MRYRILAAVVTCCGTCLLTAKALSSPPNSEAVSEARNTLSKWVETRRLISQEKRNWQRGRETLHDRIALVNREIESVRARTAEAEKSLAEAEKAREELTRESEDLREASEVLAGAAASLEGRTKGVLPRLPEAIGEKVEPLSRRIPENSDETRLSLGERFQNIVGILNAINKFNGLITVTPESRTLSDGTRAEVTVMYVGIGQGYYVTADGKSAGMGGATPEGWIWRTANAAVSQIAKAIAIHRNETPASFVPLPVEIE